MDQADQPETPHEAQSLAAVILGNDAVVAARPCTSAQLANACCAAGFDLVIPPAWGDELVAATYLEQLAGQREPVIIGCACPRVASLLEYATNVASLRRVSIAPPPVVAARSLRAVHGDGIVITYVGDCPGAADPAIDIRFSSADLFAVFERQGVRVADQSTDLDARQVERWQRHYSVPGGLPALRFLGRPPVDRVLRSIDAPALRDGRIPPSRSNVLVDVADGAGCVCGGARDRIEDGEPQRRAAPVVTRPPGVSTGPLPTVRPPRVVRLHGPVRDVGVDLADLEVQDETPPVPPPPAVARGPSLRHALPMAAAPAAVLILVSALGVAVYAGTSSRERPVGASPVAAERSAMDGDRPAGGTHSPAPPTLAPTAAGSQRPDIPLADSAPLRAAATPAAFRARDPTAQDAATEARDSVTRDSLGRVASRRRAKTAAVEVVPGWMPQGRPQFAPADSAVRTQSRSSRPQAAADTTRPPT